MPWFTNLDGEDHPKVGQSQGGRVARPKPGRKLVRQVRAIAHLHMTSRFTRQTCNVSDFLLWDCGDNPAMAELSGSISGRDDRKKGQRHVNATEEREHTVNKKLPNQIVRQMLLAPIFGPGT